MTNVNKCDVHEKSVILFLNSSSGPYNMAFGSVSESDFKTAVTLRISELWDVVDRRAALFVLLLRFLWRKLCLQISFTSQRSSCRCMSKLRCQHEADAVFYECFHMLLYVLHKRSQ